MHQIEPVCFLENLPISEFMNASISVYSRRATLVDSESVHVTLCLSMISSGDLGLSSRDETWFIIKSLTSVLWCNIELKSFTLDFSSFSEIVHKPAYSCSKSMRMYRGSLRHILIASFCNFWSLSMVRFGATMKEMLPYSISGRMYVLYSLMATRLSTPARVTTLKTFKRLFARASTSSTCFVKFSFSSNSTPKNRADVVGAIVSLNSAILKLSSTFPFSLENITKFDLAALSFMRHLLHQPTLQFFNCIAVSECR